MPWETRGVTAAVSRLSEQDLYHELSVYTLELRDPEFIHQHVVDAFAVQHADPDSKPMALVFGLVGLYLHLEKGFTGRQVQRAHMELAHKRKQWIVPSMPEAQPAGIGVADVLAAEPGSERNAMIGRWCGALWQVGSMPGLRSRE